MQNNLPTTIKESDITESERVKVQEYIDAGLPGISDVKESHLYQMYDLYLSGSTYSQISVALNMKKVTVLYLAYTSDWYTSKKEYLNEVEEKMKNRVVESKLRSKEFMLILVQAWQKKITSNLHKYLSTSDDSHMERIDLKEVSQLMKAIDMINELDATGRDPKGKPSPIGLNVGDGVTIEKQIDGKISITPNSTVGSALKQFADSKRNEERIKQQVIDSTKENLSKSKEYDISNKEGDSNES